MTMEYDRTSGMTIAYWDDFATWRVTTDITIRPRHCAQTLADAYVHKDVKIQLYYQHASSLQCI